MEIHGSNITYNVENVLRQNILNSDYFRNDCSKLTTWEAVVDEIFYHVDNVEPWLSGNARGPSTAFCLLYRLFTLKLTEEQIRETISHEDSPYIRAVSAGQYWSSRSTAACQGDPQHKHPAETGWIPIPALRVRSQEPLELVRTVHARRRGG